MILSLLACPATNVCTNHTQCNDGYGCIEGQCQTVECIVNTECPIESYCDGAKGECVAGCEHSDDCFMSDRCNLDTNVCESRTCIDTQTDCATGERCDAGECSDDPLPHCEPCSSGAQCGGEGSCWFIGEGDGSYCFFPCNPESADACPAGFQCTGIDSFYCFSNCALIDQ